MRHSGHSWCMQVLAAVADNGTCSLWAWQTRMRIGSLDLPKGGASHASFFVARIALSLRPGHQVDAPAAEDLQCRGY